MFWRSSYRLFGSGVLLTASLYAGARRIGPMPALGPILDPHRGVWAVATVAELPREQSVTIPGLHAEVKVTFDDRGVPHIFASSSEDAALALGYVTARERLFQLETRWRVAGGRMAELVGDRALGLDRYMRGLGLAWTAERDFARLDPQSAATRELEAYARGVNARIAALGARGIPLEYRILGAKPSRWEPAFSFYVAKLMGWDLTFSVASDLRRLRLQAQVGETAANALLPQHNPIQEPIQPNGTGAPRFDFALLSPPGEPDLDARREANALELAAGPYGSVEDEGLERLGSNNWVVAPGRTAAGYALLAGDPHLGLTLPSIWYEAHLVVPGDLDVYGASIPGLPMIILGFNRDVAWSWTNTGADIIDYYEEEFDDAERPSRYLIDGEWRALERRIEEYRGRGGRLLATDTFYHTHRGPIVSPDERPLSMRWLVLEGVGEIDAMRGAARAGSVEEWLEAMERFATPAQNMVVADRAGTIAIRSTGQFPYHPDGRGVEIRKGESSANDWVGFWPVDRYPFSINPEQGYLASANQEPLDPHVDDTYLGADWPSPWRAMRINKLLRRDSAVTPDAMRRYQTDPGNERANFFLPYFLDAVERHAGTADAEALNAARRLAVWDRQYTKENESAVLFEYAMNELVQRTWDELEVEGEDGSARRITTPSSAILAGLLLQAESEWWDDRRTSKAVEDRDAILLASLSAAYERAVRDHGDPGSGGWRWDGIRHANIWHLLRIPSLSALELPVQGGPGNLNPSAGGGTHGASWRMVVELGPEMAAWTIYPGGQSGNPVSRRYDDRIEKWLNGELDAVHFPRESSQLTSERVIGVFHLSPAK